MRFSTQLVSIGVSLAAPALAGAATVSPASPVVSVRTATAAAAEAPRAPTAAAASEVAATPLEGDLLSRVRRLTYDGRRAGEGYFSADGSKLVFQSEREEGNPFYQIYQLDLQTGATRRVSPGIGKTTCSFLRPGTNEILYASTHHDPRSLDLQREEIELRASGRERRYAWDYDPEMELYVADPVTLEPRRLTDVYGYDAEASYSPDGRWIVFSSTRSGYDPATAEEGFDVERAKQLETDPAFFGEIYLMPAEGGEARRLTQVPGYDGGPFFFADGSRIVWRRFDENGLVADVWTMKPDGSDQRRITDFGAMSWAPWTDPTASYILFASNKLGFSNFEIYLVDAAGAKEPVRVTWSDGFDGLPVLSPDGRTLAWTSTRHGEPGGQIFVGEWNHERALAAIEAAPPRPPAQPQETAAATDDGVAELRADVERLAAPELGGRLTGTAGERAAAAFLAEELAAIGARPLPGQDDLLVPFEFTAGARDAGSRLRLEGATPAEWGSGSEGPQVQALSFSDDGEVSGDVVFAGYGIKVPDEKGLAYDSFFGLDLAGKIAIVLRYFPEDADEETRAVLSRYSGLRYKAMHAREAGAAGLMVVTGPRSGNAGELVPMTFDTAISGSGVVAASITGEVAQKLFTAAGRDLAAAQAALDTANPHVGGFALDGVRVTLDVAIERERRQGHNVIGVLPPRAGTPAVERPWLLLGAHYDHLGEGRHGNSLARKGEAGQVHRGADDNASGTAAVLATAARLAKAPGDRGVVVALWSGEELGLLGSTDFVRQPVLAPDSLVACLNFDMVGRARDNKLVVQGVGSSAAWRRLVEQANVAVGFDLQLQDDPQLPTDSASFDRVGVPCLNFFTGGHEDYHRPSDTPEKLNYEDLGRVVDLAANLARRLLSVEEPIEFTKVEPKIERGPAPDAVRAFTGTIPDYTTEVEGLKLAGVIEGGPADEAGLAEGDVIVEFGGRKITNIYDYTYALEAVKVGVPLQVVYLRGGERRETTVTPRARS